MVRIFLHSLAHGFNASKYCFYPRLEIGSKKQETKKKKRKNLVQNFIHLFKGR